MYIGISRETKLYWKKVKLSREYKLIPVRFCFFLRVNDRRRTLCQWLATKIRHSKQLPYLRQHQD